MADIAPNRLAALVELWERFAHLPLSRRVTEYVRAVRAQGDKSAFARPAHYLATPKATDTVNTATYTLRLDRSTTFYVACSIANPDTANDVTVSALMKGGFNHVDADCLGETFLTNDGDVDESRDLPHPLVMVTGGTLQLACSGTALNTSGIPVRGFSIDETTARVIEEAGELWVEGINHTFAAGGVANSVYKDVTPRKMTVAKRQTHLVAKETLTGDAKRDNVDILVKGDKLNPVEGAIIPPRSINKGGALLDVDYANGDTMQVTIRYLSAGGAGTAALSLTLLGRRKFGSSMPQTTVAAVMRQQRAVTGAVC